MDGWCWIDRRKYGIIGKRGKGGGANDPRPLITAIALQDALDNPNSTAADIAKKEENHSKALALQQKARVGKSGGGKNGAKKTSTYLQYKLSLLYSH